MSNNIHNTKTEIIKQDITNLIYELRTNPTTSPTYLEEKYHYLFNTSSSLFKMIITDVKRNDFNLELFQKKLYTMLDYILKIQESKISQETASKEVGLLLGKEYIPKELYKEEDYKKLYTN